MQEMMGRLPSLLQAELDGRGREESGGAVRARRRCGGIVCSAEQPPRAASGGGVREGDTAGGESSSRPGVEGVLVRTVEVPAEGVWGISQHQLSVRRFGDAAVVAAGGTTRVV